MIEINDQVFYTVSEISKIVNVRIETVRHWIKHRQLKAKKLGRAYMIQGRHLRQLLERGTRYG